MFRNMTQKVIYWALILTLLLTACAQTSNGVSSNATRPPAQTATIAENPAQTATLAENPIKTTAAPTVSSPTVVSKPEEIKYVYPAFEMPKEEALTEVQAALNGMLAAKNINATLILAPLPFGSYTDKVNLMLASGESCDILFNTAWLAPSHDSLLVNGAILGLTEEQLQTNAPEAYNTLPKAAWDALKVDGKYTAIPNNGVFYKDFGARIRADLMAKYNVDPASLKKTSDLTSLFEQIKANGDTRYIFSRSDNSSIPSIVFMAEMAGFDIQSPQDVGVAVRYDDQDLKAFNLYDTPEFRDAMDLVYQWNQAGFIDPDVEADSNAFQAAWNNGIYASTQLGTISPGNEITDNIGINPDKQMAIVSLTPDRFMSTAAIAANMNSICTSSKNPELALQVLNAFGWEDENMYNTLTWGIEGKQWVWADQANKVIGDGPNKADYNTQSPWMFGNTLLSYYVDPKLAELKVNDSVDKLNKEAAASVALGFTFNSEQVKNEIAQVTAVVKEVGYPLMNGDIDPTTGVDDFNKKLDAAGMGKIVAEMQNQLDAWNAAN